mmetsp:Transcript_15255/g.34851  ORF Transcript_15255/g.34851 Transcript_15255/m.34851 type:complete len:267 (+) Transcript_15255:38-838(+)
MCYSEVTSREQRQCSFPEKNVSLLFLFLPERLRPALRPNGKGFGLGLAGPGHGSFQFGIAGPDKVILQAFHQSVEAGASFQHIPTDGIDENVFFQPESVPMRVDTQQGATACTVNGIFFIGIFQFQNPFIFLIVFFFLLFEQSFQSGLLIQWQTARFTWNVVLTSFPHSFQHGTVSRVRMEHFHDLLIILSIASFPGSVFSHLLVFLSRVPAASNFIVVQNMMFVLILMMILNHRVFFIVGTMKVNSPTLLLLLLLLRLLGGSGTS